MKAKDYKKENEDLKKRIGRFCKDCSVPLESGDIFNPKCEEKLCPFYPLSPLRSKKYPLN